MVLIAFFIDFDRLAAELSNAIDLGLEPNIITRQWSASYTWPGSRSDNAHDIAVDAKDNVYVTGSSIGAGTNADYATVKYAKNGNDLWLTRYNGPGNGSDYAKVIVVDKLSNVYITGSSVGSGTSHDYCTIKYGPNGNQLWVARYNSTNSNYVRLLW